MAAREQLVDALLKLVEDAFFANPWHSIAAAKEDLTDDALDYEPVPAPSEEWSGDPDTEGILTIRNGLEHMARDAREPADLLAGGRGGMGPAAPRRGHT